LRLTTSAEVKNEWSYISVLSVCLRGMYRNDFTLPLMLNSGSVKTDMFKNVFAFFLSVTCDVRNTEKFAVQTVGV